MLTTPAQTHGATSDHWAGVLTGSYWCNTGYLDETILPHPADMRCHESWFAKHHKGTISIWKSLSSNPRNSPIFGRFCESTLSYPPWKTSSPCPGYHLAPAPAPLCKAGDFLGSDHTRGHLHTLDLPLAQEPRKNKDYPQKVFRKAKEKNTKKTCLGKALKTTKIKYQITSNHQNLKAKLGYTAWPNLGHSASQTPLVSASRDFESSKSILSGELMIFFWRF